MRGFALSATVVLALACGASAAVAAIPTGQGSSIVVERPGDAQHDATPTPTPHKHFPSSIATSVVAVVAQKGAYPEDRCNTADCHTTSLASPNDIESVTAGGTAPDANDNSIAVNDVDDAEITVQVDSFSGVSPYTTFASIIASYAHSIAYLGARLLSEFSKSAESSDDIIRRDEIEEHAHATRTSRITIHSTSTIASVSA